MFPLNCKDKETTKMIYHSVENILNAKEKSGFDYDNLIFEIIDKFSHLRKRNKNISNQNSFDKINKIFYQKSKIFITHETNNDLKAVSSTLSRIKEKLILFDKIIYLLNEKFLNEIGNSMKNLGDFMKIIYCAILSKSNTQLKNEASKYENMGQDSLRSSLSQTNMSIALSSMKSPQVEGSDKIKVIGELTTLTKSTIYNLYAMNFEITDEFKEISEITKYIKGASVLINRHNNNSLYFNENISEMHIILVSYCMIVDLFNDKKKAK